MATAPEARGGRVKSEAARADLRLERELTVRDVFGRHRALVWWCFYWSMAAVAW